MKKGYKIITKEEYKRLKESLITIPEDRIWDYLEQFHFNQKIKII